MWFIFGVISLIAFTVYFGKKRHDSNWAGTPASTQGIKYTHQTVYNKHKVSYMQLGCITNSNSKIDFSIKPETKLDKLFKLIGISVEHQVGKDAFDKAIYIISDHSTICNVLSKSNALQNEILGLIDACKKHELKFHGMHIHNQRIWVKVSPLSKKNIPNIQVIAKDIIPQLTLISDLLLASLSHVESSMRDPFYFRAGLFLAVSTGMAVMGGLHIFTLVMLKEPFILEVNKLFTMSLVLGSLIIGILTLMMIAFLGRSARTHLVLIELMTIGYFGAISSTLTLARDINIEWDSSSPKKYVVQVHNKTISRGRRSTTYYVHVDDWTGRKHQKRISISGSKYRSFNIGDKLEIDQHDGYLGIKWVNEIKSYSQDF